ncbi:hypothetical protein ARMGADRAFT_1036003 [Armillaria gallica]|uniref:Uncharacterized protein n=1 Tax=Armillaria gallica TaxID=47427 RepID=A0A2H3CRY1_ARMGA|nr:hypothetical protein ARMGADRAFT_1036003 [Armillaria gallica]
MIHYRVPTSSCLQALRVNLIHCNHLERVRWPGLFGSSEGLCGFPEHSCRLLTPSAARPHTRFPKTITCSFAAFAFSILLHFCRIAATPFRQQNERRRPTMHLKRHNGQRFCASGIGLRETQEIVVREVRELLASNRWITLKEKGDVAGGDRER